MASNTKTKRIVIRVSDSEKKILESAARLKKQSLSSYIVDVISNQANLDIRKNEAIILDNTQRDSLLDLLDNPPLPNDELRALLTR